MPVPMTHKEAEQFCVPPSERFVISSWWMPSPTLLRARPIVPGTGCIALSFLTLNLQPIRTVNNVQAVERVRLVV